MEKSLQDELIKATILYRIGDCKEHIPTATQGTRFSAIDEELTWLYTKSYINVTEDEKYYVIDDKGKECLAKLVGMYDQFLKFEVFSEVNIAKELTEEVSEDGENVYDHCFDPRFEGGNYDLRPAMMAFAVEAAKREGEEIQELNPRRIVFLTKLVNKEFVSTSPNFWQKLKIGAVFTEIDEILASLRTWQSLGDDEEDSYNVSETIYRMGMIEARKRQGTTCSKCNIPLGVFEEAAKADGHTLDECPNPDCDGDFREPPTPEPDDYECPSCGSNIKEGQSSCYGCGATVNFSLPSGTITSETVEETVTDTSYVYDDYYDPYWGYNPYTYGYYDPWYPASNAMALGFVCGAILI